MIRNALLFTVLTTSLIIVNNCCAAEKSVELEQQSQQQKLIILTKGLLTTIKSPALANLKRSGFFAEFAKTSLEKIVPCKKESLAHLMARQVMFYNYDNSVDRYSLAFCPVVIRINKSNSSNSTTIFGLFNSIQHLEAIEACRANKAAFYQYQHGAIVYSFKQKLDINFFDEDTRKKIEKIITDSIQEKIILSAPMVSFY